MVALFSFILTALLGSLCLASTYPHPLSPSDLNTRTTKSLRSSSKSSKSSTVASKTVLDLHNAFRAHYQAKKLVYNETLAKGSAEWSARCDFVHSKGKYGENLAAGTGSYSFADGFNDWGAENKTYHVGTFSHFTQVVWKDTKSVGCGVAKCNAGTIFPKKFGSTYFYTCRYYPEGNIIGKDAKEVGKFKAKV